jgi:hypothetical protein
VGRSVRCSLSRVLVSYATGQSRLTGYGPAAGSNNRLGGSLTCYAHDVVLRAVIMITQPGTRRYTALPIFLIEARVLLRLALGDYEPPAGYGVIFRQENVQGLL